MAARAPRSYDMLSLIGLPLGVAMIVGGHVAEGGKLGSLLQGAAALIVFGGTLGAVLGLIHVMENLSDPSKLGAGIAVAFVATVYGVGSANLILLPVAAKLRSRALRRARRREVILEGVLAIQEGQNPRLIDQKLRGLLAAEEAPPPAGVRRRAA